MRIYTDKRRGGAAISSDVRVEENGQELTGISKLEITAGPDDLVLARCEFALIERLELEAEAQYLLRHPIEGDLRDVARIVFADGTEWSADG